MVQVVRQAYVWLISGALLLFVLGGLIMASVLTGRGAEAQDLRLRTERAALLLERSELDSERTQVTSQFNQVQRDLLTERAKRLELEKILVNVQSELGRTQDQLAFFEDLFPPGPQGALDLRAVAVTRHAEGLHYRVLLMRSGKATKPFVGALQFIATGYCREAAVATEQTIILQPLLARPAASNAAGLGAQHPLGQTPPTEAQQSELQPAKIQQLEAQPTEAQRAALRLDFAQFQRGQGLLALPRGFAPTSVTVRVVEGDIVLVSKVVAL
jgi:hypothetical protein